LGNFGENPKKFDDDSDKAFYLFLLRRKGYCLIERQNYKEAKAMFNKVLSYNKDDQMAKSELKYIDECEKKIKEDKKKK
jgi:tetratricopeptide (TPR) repeat protein